MMRMFARIMLLAIVLLIAACGQQNAATPVPLDVDMTVRVEPEPLSIGEATLIVNLKDASGTPLENAVLQVHGDMDHAGMTPVDREVRESTNGEYLVPFEWSMGGGWIVTITARLADGREISEMFNFFVEAVSSESIINQNANADAESTPDGTEDILISYQPDNNPALGGDATVTITITDQDGNAISDATVEVVGDMVHAGMMPVSGTGEHTEAGQYIVPLSWTMAGDWIVTVKVSLADGREIEQEFEQQVVTP